MMLRTYERIVTALRTFRRDVTILQLAEELGMSPTTVTKIRHGKKGPRGVNTDTLTRLDEYLRQQPCCRSLFPPPEQESTSEAEFFSAMHAGDSARLQNILQKWEAEGTYSVLALLEAINDVEIDHGACP